MKRNDLIKLLEENFTEDEDVKFVYTDDQGDVRGDVQYVDIHEQTIVHSHYEWLEIDEKWKEKWVRITNKERDEILYLHKRNGKFITEEDVHKRLRWVEDGVEDNAQKCVFIS